eukprot:6165204-Pleurochrysis_carterae.AAC.1
MVYFTKKESYTGVRNNTQPRGCWLRRRRANDWRMMGLPKSEFLPLAIQSWQLIEQKKTRPRGRSEGLMLGVACLELRCVHIRADGRTGMHAVRESQKDAEIARDAVLALSSYAKVMYFCDSLSNLGEKVTKKQLCMHASSRWPPAWVPRNVAANGLMRLAFSSSPKQSLSDEDDACMLMGFKPSTSVQPTVEANLTRLLPSSFPLSTPSPSILLYTRVLMPGMACKYSRHESPERAGCEPAPDRTRKMHFDAASSDEGRRVNKFRVDRNVNRCKGRDNPQRRVSTPPQTFRNLCYHFSLEMFKRRKFPISPPRENAVTLRPENVSIPPERPKDKWQNRVASMSSARTLHNHVQTSMHAKSASLRKAPQARKH